MFAIFKKLAWFFKLRWKTYLLAISGLIACAILSAMIPLIIGNAVDEMARGVLSQDALYRYIFLLLAIGLLMYGLRYMWRNNLFGNSTRLEAILRNRLFDHFTKMDQEFYSEYRTGDLMAHATNDLASLRFVAGGGILTLTDSLSITVVTLFSMIFLIDWKLTLYTILPFPLLILVARYMGQLINRYYRQALEAFSQMNDRVQESIAGMKVIKAFGEEEADYQDFHDETQNVVAKNRQVYKIDSAYTPSIDMITGLTYVLTIFFGTYFVQSGRISIGQLVAYFSYLGNMTWPLLAVGRLVNTMERGNASYDRITDLLATTARVENDPHPLNGLAYQSLQVKIDEFTYPGAERPSLTDLSIDLTEGQSLGLVGRTGSGKSTIFNLLVRNYDLEHGAILYDGQDIKRIDLHELNRKVGYISQNNLLFSTTVRDNIRFGRPEMDQAEVEKYAKIAEVHEDILSFPEGYDTLVGERGVSLSGGQKQRISIARTLAIEPTILIMDDALSAVDAKTEQKILSNLRSYRQSGITIIATHRLSSIMRADEILVLDDGKVSERGSHEELLANRAWYENMFNQQQLEAKLAEGGDEDESEIG
ncbi:ABC transporter ATP-binding protein [Ignavigranum ruoffiae]|uniref:ABC transporter ATP-binding protein n=1 Tax=Ignavigranum ruoffiae TaxID=89093 RepID=UPI0024ACF90A|nr:ABC transporter transmembrane domain-containing protein [Ignavigranum ruoffiae]